MKTTLALLLLAAPAFAANDLMDAEQTAQFLNLRGNFILVAEKARAPKLPTPAAAVCPADASRGAGRLTWDDLKNSFHDEAGVIADEQEFAAAFSGAWIKVGEVRDPNQYGRYNAEGLHVDDLYEPVSRSGFIGGYGTTAGALGGPHFDVRMATFDRQHKVRPGESRHPARFEGMGASYVINGYKDIYTDEWTSARLREIRIVRPRDGGKAVTAVVRDAAMRERGEGAHFYSQYCKVSD